VQGPGGAYSQGCRCTGCKAAAQGFNCLNALALQLGLKAPQNPFLEALSEALHLGLELSKVLQTE